MRRFSLKIALNRWNKHSRSRTVAWTQTWGKDLKDKRSKGVTKADQKNASKDFIRMVKGQMDKHPGMSQKEAMDKVMSSEAFTTKEERSLNNIRKTARQFNIRVNKNGLEQVSSNQWQINQGPHQGHMLMIQHIPGGYPSYQIVII